MQRSHELQTSALALFALVLGACEGSKPPAAGAGDSVAATSVSADQSLYERLGGKAAITSVVDDFVANVAADARINARFANTDIPHLKQMLVDQIC